MNNTGSQVEEQIFDGVEDIEESAKEGRSPRRAKRYRIRIDKEHHIVEVAQMTGRDLLNLAGKQPVEQWSVFQRFSAGERKKIGVDEVADFTTPGVERFVTVPLDQTDG